MAEDLVLQLLIAAVSHAQELGQLINTARAQKRDVSDAELDGLQAKYDLAKNAVLAEIAKQRAST
jgi:hypothetical protein